MFEISNHKTDFFVFYHVPLLNPEFVVKSFIINRNRGPFVDAQIGLQSPDSRFWLKEWQLKVPFETFLFLLNFRVYNALVIHHSFCEFDSSLVERCETSILQGNKNVRISEAYHLQIPNRFIGTIN